MNYLRIIYAGLAATAVMTIFMVIGPLVGLPGMNLGELLGKPLGNSEAAGWITHFIIGIILVIPYAFVLNRWIPVENKVARGMLYGLLVFVFSQIVLISINISGYFAWEDKQQMGLMVAGLAIANMMYGCVVGSFYPRLGTDELSDSKNPPVQENNAGQKSTISYKYE